MIVRFWRGRAPAATASAYEKHATETVFPSLGRLAGHRGAWLLRRGIEGEGETEFVVLTLWDSLDSIEAFAGDHVTTAIVEPEGRAALSTFDEFATHYEVAFRTS
ncbi:antibiotic biosynthesis monooxygenase [Reyranella sp.]|jgi:heme-degrading monooxygenase HmoA|uniref:antibiotic biosynthesis monooxygenase family protein n=1 Tax=Reyranella sp. TaxID=1929291 RepID=UPI002F956E97